MYPNLYDPKPTYMVIICMITPFTLGVVAQCKNLVNVKVVAKLCHEFQRKVCSLIGQKSMRGTMSKHNSIQNHLGNDSNFD